MNFLKDFKGEILKAVIGLMVVFLIAKFDYVVSIFDTGKAIEKQTQFESNLKVALRKDSIVSSLMENKEFVKLLFESETVKKHINKIGEELHDKIVVDVTKSDSNKVSMRSFVGMGAGIRDEQVLPIIAEIVKAWNEKEVAKKKDVKTIIKNNVKPGSLKPAQF
ncbi:MAG: hypothetical protein KAS12_00790 [Candidatus Aenigmarchaeota archaeon]|nr:hypothetical protein [Candidatus Aenigmarchaeota archaeon]